MVPTMVAYNVTGFGECANDVWLLLDEAAEDKERRLHIMLRQHIHQPERAGIVGAVVIGECQLARAGRQSNERASVER